MGATGEGVRYSIGGTDTRTPSGVGSGKLFSEASFFHSFLQLLIIYPFSRVIITVKCQIKCLKLLCYEVSCIDLEKYLDNVCLSLRFY